jgi:hypothetical protein
MRNVRRIVLIALVTLAAAALPGTALAQFREFSGKVDKIDKKKIFVDNRMGDKVSFEKVDETVVEGTKTEWDKIKKEDWVTVSWKMIDKPRKAYKVVVSPPKEEEGEEVE